jgi:UDP-glucose 4-epimerase
MYDGRRRGGRADDLVGNRWCRTHRVARGEGVRGSGPGGGGARRLVERSRPVDTSLVEQTLAKHQVSGVVHLAGFSTGVSMIRPVHTYEQNVTGTVHLVAAMASQGVEQIVFSSSAAVYGTPSVDLVTANTPTRPESPYGQSKLIAEWLSADQGIRTNLRHTSLRYFNIVGSADRFS